MEKKGLPRKLVIKLAIGFAILVDFCVPLPGAPTAEAPATAPADHWAFQPVRRAQLPKVKNTIWSRSPIDRFIVAKLEEKGLTPSPATSKQTLLRRLTFDLDGLPPSLEETEAFQRDESPDAIERVVDRLLGSGQFGERWARHWLDVARYADSNGSDENFTYYDAWRFRNYVINAFNKDKPFDQFVREQIDTIGKAFLGLTLGCARCHDHKFDPVPTRDYYALAGILGSTETVHGNLLHRRDLSGWNLRPLGQDGDKLYKEWLVYDEKLDGLKKKREQAQADLARLKKKIEATTNEVRDASVTNSAAPPSPAAGVAAVQEEISKLEQTLKSLATEIKQLSDAPRPKPPLAMAVADRETIADTAIRLRGEVHRSGEVVPRGFVQVAGQSARAFPAGESGRAELAEWLIDPANPLTSRVVVNRIWHHLFGVGLVRTVDDFGRQGEPPSHPELLDYLAARFRDVNWSFKRMIREIVLSRAYQMSSGHRDKAFRADPENRLLWRMNRRRLDIETLRDSILAISDQLDFTPAESVVKHLPDQATGVGDKPHKPLESLRRSVYLPVIRNDLRPEFQVFDFADPQTVSGRRNQTMVAPQALFLMNGRLLRDSAQVLAKRLWKQAGTHGENEVVRAAYSEILGRSPSAGEIRSALDYLAEGGSKNSETEPKPALATFCHALMCSSQFLYVD